MIYKHDNTAFGYHQDEVRRHLSHSLAALTPRRMQSIEASSQYKNSFACAAKIFRDEGVRTFWSGAAPRLVRLVFSGGIVFTVYVWTSYRSETC